ncbi:MAG: hypothetical protein Ta2E_04320 [Mycoplasmoidaceae bacterium]|nr:MAG: hypothetical protein Ta2E_04320 [Mycoplasmoidaceae bacterium]
MAKIFNLIILTPQGKAYESNVYSVSVKTTLGTLTLLADHAKIISSIKTNNITINTDKLQECVYGIGSGVLKFEKNKLIILTDWCKLSNANTDPKQLRNKDITDIYKTNKEDDSYDIYLADMQDDIKDIIK